jgi:phosphoglycerol transferase MdoB-like AlkP superfamily enzyme
MGFRVDAAIIFTFTSLLWIALILPFKFTLNKTYKTLIGLLWGVIIASIIFFNIGDSLYFGFVNRHISNELSVMGNDMGILVVMAKDYFPLQTLVSIILFILIVWLFYKIFTAKLKNINIRHTEWFLLPVVVLIAFVGIRGKVDGISFGTSDAFATNKVSSGNLALNGFFCFYRGGDRQNICHAAINTKDALKISKESINSQNSLFTDPAYPLMRHYKKKNQPKYNVVIILVESLSGKYLDALSHNDYKVTPNLDKLAQEGILYTNFFANGQRSLEGITSIYTGLTQPVGFENLGEGLELYNPSFLGKIAHQNGYTTIAMQASDRGSFRVDKLSKLAGFKDYYGAEDMPHTGVEVGSPHFGVWDGDMLRFLSSKLHTIKEPFISFSFTASMHSPFYLPGEQWQKYPHAPNDEQGYLNTLYYTDSQIAEFMQRCKQEPWFDRTIFIFTADHVGFAELTKMVEKPNLTDNSLLPDFHIPLIIYAPKIFKPHTSDIVASHDDIFPSLIDILGWKGEFTTLSQSLFDTSVKERFAYVKRGSMIAITDGNGAIGYNFKEFIDSKGSVNEHLKDLLLALDTAEASLLKNSHWIKVSPK